MSGFAWILLDLALIAGAVYGTRTIIAQPAPKPVKLDAPAAKTKGSAGTATKSASNNATRRGGTPATARKEPGESRPARQRLHANAKLDVLWQDSLFHPDRTENTPTPGTTAETGPAQGALANVNIDFELVGIAQIAVPGKEPAPVAVIRFTAPRGRGNRRFGNNPQQPYQAGNRGAFTRNGNAGTRDGQNNTRENGSRFSRNNQNGTRENGSRFSRNGQPMQPEPEKPHVPKTVFRIGETIDETGYVLQSINVAERSAVVVRNGQPVTLEIDFTGLAAQQRRNAAAQAAAQAAAKRRQAEAAAAQAAARAAQGGTPQRPNTAQQAAQQRAAQQRAAQQRAAQQRAAQQRAAQQRAAQQRAAQQRNANNTNRR